MAVKTLKFAGALAIAFALGGVITAINAQLEDARRSIATIRNALDHAPAIVTPVDGVVYMTNEVHAPR